MANSTDRRPNASGLPATLLANASAGLFGLQIVWGLQSVTTSRVLQSLGAETADLAFLWVAAPMTGLVVQPVVGWLSDRTHGRFGRRRPYIVAGALLSAAALILMGSATSLAVAVAALWLLTFSVNIAMQPMRALIADIVHRDDLTRAYSMQVVFIGSGAIFASCLPWLLAHAPGMDPLATGIRSSLGLAFVVGAMTLLASVGWTLAKTLEPRPPRAEPVAAIPVPAPRLRPYLWLILGAAVAAGSVVLDIRREVWLLAAILILYGLLEILVLVRRRRRPASSTGGIHEIVMCIAGMPPVMRRLSVIQFFTWFALFTVWVYAVPSIAAHQYGNAEPGSPAYGAAADWVGVLFGVQDAVAVLAALALPRVAAVIGIARCHALCLSIGAVSFVTMSLMPGGGALVLPWAGVGIAWASILLAPYAIVAGSVPNERLGLNLGVHNIFLVLPQLVGASVLGFTIQNLFHDKLDLVMPVAAASFAIAAVLSVRLASTMRQPTSLMQDLA